MSIIELVELVELVELARLAYKPVFYYHLLA